MFNDKRNTYNFFIVEERKGKDNTTTVKQFARKKPVPKQKVNLG
jgi:hypothetical protein